VQVRGLCLSRDFTTTRTVQTGAPTNCHVYLECLRVLSHTYVRRVRTHTSFLRRGGLILLAKVRLLGYPTRNMRGEGGQRPRRVYSRCQSYTDVVEYKCRYSLEAVPSITLPLQDYIPSFDFSCRETAEDNYGAL